MTKTILVVDDDDMLRDTLTLGLRKNGFDVIRAESAEFADKILSRVVVDAVVLDRMMPGMDGLSFLKKMRQNGNDTPVIMLTAMSGPDNTIDGLSDGANDYMAKPFQLQELILRLNNIVKNTKNTGQTQNVLPNKLTIINNDFFIKTDKDNTNKLLALSNEEKKLLQNMLNPIGNVVSATPMVAKRLRNKINSVLSDIDIITVRGMGYKIIIKAQ